MLRFLRFSSKTSIINPETYMFLSDKILFNVIHEKPDLVAVNSDINDWDRFKSSCYLPKEHLAILLKLKLENNEYSEIVKFLSKFKLPADISNKNIFHPALYLQLICKYKSDYSTEFAKVANTIAKIRLSQAPVESLLLNYQKLCKMSPENAPFGACVLLERLHYYINNPNVSIEEQKKIDSIISLVYSMNQSYWSLDSLMVLLYWIDLKPFEIQKRREIVQKLTNLLHRLPENAFDYVMSKFSVSNIPLLVFKIFDNLVEKGYIPSPNTLSLLLKVCATHKLHGNGLRLIDYIQTLDFADELASDIQDFCILLPSVPPQVRNWIEQVVWNPHKWNVSIVQKMLSRAIEINDYKDAFRIVSHSILVNFDGIEELYTRFIQVFMKNGQFKMAIDYFFKTETNSNQLFEELMHELIVKSEFNYAADLFLQQDQSFKVENQQLIAEFLMKITRTNILTENQTSDLIGRLNDSHFKNDELITEIVKYYCSLQNFEACLKYFQKFANVPSGLVRELLVKVSNLDFIDEFGCVFLSELIKKYEFTSKSSGLVELRSAFITIILFSKDPKVYLNFLVETLQKHQFLANSKFLIPILKSGIMTDCIDCAARCSRLIDQIGDWNQTESNNYSRWINGIKHGFKGIQKSS